MKVFCKNCIRKLGHESRLQIFDLVSRNLRMSVSEIVASLKIKQPTVSYHLKILEKQKLLNSSKEGKQVFYSVNEQCSVYDHKCIFLN